MSGNNMEVEGIFPKSIYNNGLNNHCSDTVELSLPWKFVMGRVFSIQVYLTFITMTGFPKDDATKSIMEGSGIHP